MAPRRNSVFRVFCVSSALLVAALAAGCGPAVPEYTLVSSQNGHLIKLERKGPVQLGDRGLAFKVAYRTDLPIDYVDRTDSADNADSADDPDLFGDAAALRAEVEEVWRTFQAEADAAGVELALIEARALRGERWSRIGRSQRFAFRKRKTGSWELVERQAAKTTAVKPL